MEHDTTVDVSDPQAMLGYARRFFPIDVQNTDAWLKELREGDATDSYAAKLELAERPTTIAVNPAVPS